jgi:hypothetical protein
VVLLVGGEGLAAAAWDSCGRGLSSVKREELRAKAWLRGPVGAPAMPR